MPISDNTMKYYIKEYMNKFFKAWRWKTRNLLDKNHYIIGNHEKNLYLYNISNNKLGINRKFKVRIFARYV